MGPIGWASAHRSHHRVQTYTVAGGTLREIATMGRAHPMETYRVGLGPPPPSSRINVHRRRRHVEPRDTCALDLEPKLRQKLARHRARRPVRELDEPPADAKHVEHALQDRALCRPRHRKHPE